MVAGGGIEPPTLGLWIPRSNHLSYPATFRINNLQSLWAYLKSQVVTESYHRASHLMLVPSITAWEEIVFAVCLDTSNQRARERGNFLPRSDLNECAKVNDFIGRLVRFALRTVPQDFSFCKISAKLELQSNKSSRHCSHIKYPWTFRIPGWSSIRKKLNRQNALSGTATEFLTAKWLFGRRLL